MNRNSLVVAATIVVGLPVAYWGLHQISTSRPQVVSRRETRADDDRIAPAQEHSAASTAADSEVAPVTSGSPAPTARVAEAGARSAPASNAGPTKAPPPPIAASKQNLAGGSTSGVIAQEVSLPRLALGLVGADPEAEAIWAFAINDPSLPAKERKDLIEDLNEDGIPDPKRPTPADLPLILNRLQLIEQLAPDAMDEVNAAAFAEAYKDLVEMADKIASR